MPLKLYKNEAEKKAGRDKSVAKFNAKNKAYRQAYYIRNRDRIKTQTKAHAATSKAKESRNDRACLRKLFDPEFLLLTNLRKRLCRAVPLAGTKKHEKTLELTGCLIQFLKGWLESQFKQGMTWDNYGRNGWHIDHKKPCSSFDLSKPEERKVCFHYTNLQPLWELENLVKANKVIQGL